MGQRSKETIEMAASGETGQPSTSNTQMIERQQSMEVSSFARQANKEKDIKNIFREINMRNENVKVETYAKYLKLTPPNQNRLMSTFDIKEVKI